VDFATNYSTSTGQGLARLVDGTVWKASYNAATLAGSYVRVNGASGPIRASAIAVSGSYSTALGCAIQNGVVWCFPLADTVADSSYLGAGLDNVTPTSAPVEVKTSNGSSLPAKVTQIAGGTYSSANFCAVDVNGNVWCWGYNGQGQLGVGGMSGATYARTVVNNDNTVFSDAVEVRVGYDSTCARKGTDGTVWCWGYDYYGQLGVDRTMFTVTPNYSYYPYKVPILLQTKATRLAANPHSTHCAIMSDTSVVCWGYNQESQAGFPYDSTNGTRVPTSVPASGAGATPVLMGAVDLVAGYADQQMCANIKTANSIELQCWGSASGFPNGKPYPTAGTDSNNNAIDAVTSSFTNSNYGYIGYVDPSGLVNSGGYADSQHQPRCDQLLSVDGGP
jgi:Regulator of chromosome condensation (RCC1) repeat